MKKLMAFLTVLFVSVLCTACINNFAVQELNNKAKEYLQAGDIQNAICRLQSSVDLDGNIFESRYNLAIAYIQGEDFKHAKEQIQAALKLNPEHADSFYSLAVINEGISKEILEPDVDNDDDTPKDKKAPKIDEEMIEKAVGALKDANVAYEKYLEKAKEAKDSKEVQAQIEANKEKIGELLILAGNKLKGDS